MIVVDNLKRTTIKEIVNNHLKRGSVIDTDDSNSYSTLRDLDLKHQSQVIPKEKVNEMLPWVHIAISNAKRLLLDVHHDIQPDFLQNYLNEFYYKFNRRYFGEKLFEKLVTACKLRLTNFNARKRILILSFISSHHPTKYRMLQLREQSI